MRELFQQIVNQYASQIAVRYGHEYMTFQELDDCSNRIARLILDQGVTPDECPFIGLYSSRSFYTVPMMFGILKAGFAYVPMEAKYSSERIDYIINDCGLKLILTDGAPMSDVYAGVDWLPIHQDALAAVVPQPVSTIPSRYAYVIYTSGTTGKPKGTPITRQALLNLVEARKALIPPQENTTELCLASIVFDVSVWEVFCSLLTGSSIYFISEAEKSDPQRIADLLEEQHISTFNITPTHLSVIPYRQFPELKYLVFAGEPCPQELIRKWQNTCTVIDAYGPTETTVIATACVHHHDTLANDIGLPLQGVTCYVLDEQLRQVPTGEKGELYIGGIQLTDGYLNKEELNRQKFIRNPYFADGAFDPILYASGDIVYRQPSDNHIIYCGRKDSQVKIHGFRIELGEVKTNLESCTNIDAAAVEVVGQGQRKHLRAFVTGKQAPIDLNQLKSELKGKLPPYMIPAQIVEVEQIPKNINGKTDFKALASMMPSQQEEDVLSNDTKRQLAVIWHEVLDYPGSILSSSNFLEIGGDSISVILMLQKVNQSFGVSLSVDDVYQNLVISDLAQKVSSFTPSARKSGDHHQHTSLSRLPLPAHMQTLFTHCLLNQQASLAYNLVELIPFGQTVNAEKLLEAWNQLLQLQDAFRMTFHRDSSDVSYVQIHEFAAQTAIPVAEQADDESLRQTIVHRLSQPFDLTNGSLYLTELYHLADGRWIFAVYVHHLISDGWSLDEMHKQVYALYQGNNLPAVTPFADYLTESCQREQSSAATESTTYWDSYLADAQELTLPGILSDSDTDDYTTGCVAEQMDPQLTAAIRHYCTSHQLTLFSFMSTALQLLMYRVSRQTDFTIGYPTSGRSDASYFDTLGYFVHPRPMKFTVDRLDLSFAEFCKQTMQEIRNAELHPDAMVKLPSVNFTLEAMRQETRLGVNLPCALAPLTLTVDDDDERLQCRWLYRQSLADTQQIESLSRYYLHLLQNVVSSSDDTLVRCLSLQSAEEYDAMVACNTITPIHQPQEHIIDVFSSWVQAQPHQLALKDAVSTYTYQQLDAASDVIARTLLSHQVTVCAVGLFFERSNAALIAMLGIIKAGCFYVPISPTYPEQRIREIVQDSGMGCILANKSVSETIAAVVPEVSCFCIEDLLASPQDSTEIPDVSIFPETPAYMIYTSGTTGVPKGVVVTHANIVSMVKIGAPAAYGITSADRVIQVSTYLFDASVIDIFTTLLNGALLVTAADELKEDPDRLFQLMESEHITWACLPPSFLHACDHDATTSLKTILVGGESPSHTIINRYRHIRFINGYGPTENTVCSTSHTYAAETTSSSNCIGKPLDGVTCYVLDDDRNPLPDGMTGELFLGGLQLASGYHHRPELNEKSFVPNPFVSEADASAGINTRLYATGDMVYRHTDGNLYFVGRKDHQVKIRGYRIELGDIANTLLRHIAVHQCVVEARTIGNSKQLVAHVETDSLQLTGGVLRTYLADKLPAYMIPAYWSFSRHFPLTTNGKIDSSRLPEPELYIAQKDDADDDMNQEDMKCISVVARLLGADMSAIHPDDNVISDLGMTSLHVLEFASIMQHRGYNLHPSEIYRFKTIRQIVDFYTSNESRQTMTVEQINSRICYFTSPEDKNKPLLLVVSGYPYYETEYFDFDNYFKKDYNILVIESANEYYMYHPDEPLTIDALMKGYVELLRPLLKDRELAGVTGLCIGGDMGLRLAVELNELHLAHPKVFVIDGYAKRTSYAKGLGSFVAEPGIDSDVNLRRNQIMRQMTDTFEQKYYPGEVYLMMTTHFGDENGQTKEEGEALHPINKKNWLEAQPDVHIDFLDGLHMELLHNPHDLEQIKTIIDRHLL